MNIDTKLAVLNRIYGIYSDFIHSADIACRCGCAHCCTRNVTLTTLEGYAILTRLADPDKAMLLQKIQSGFAEKRFQPRITFNQMADMCMAGKDLPEEESDAAWGRCPVLIDDQCTIYPLRPFGCRCMVSKTDCNETGYADMDPFVLTVNTVFQQTIEHVDTEGGTGNFTDVLRWLSSEEGRRQYAENRINCHAAGLLPNQPLNVLMIPPEHRDRIRPILDALRRIG